MPKGENNRNTGHSKRSSSNRSYGTSSRSEAAKKGWETRRRNMTKGKK